jgi:hypothetical protein
LTFDIATLVSTSLFFTGFDRPLPSLDLIVLEEQKQLASMLLVTTTPNPLDPMRTVEVISQAIVAEEAQTPPSASPTPSKFGTPSVITSPVPYLITNGTVITTDPSITTNGVTDFGKIYRGPMDDGAFSLWAFGSTSAVDNALDFDTNFENAGHFPLAAFKFTSLELVGNPTIDLTNGGVTNLALISVGDITSGLPGGTLTFTGLDALLLASQDGSINLGSEITFQGIPTLFFYARGTNGDLTLASPIIGTTDLFLYAGRNITFNAGTDLILGGQFSTRSAGGNISVSESGNIAIGGSLAATSDVMADAANGGNITFATGGSFSASDVVVETTAEPGSTLTDGANISFNIGTGLTVNGGSLSLTINDSNGGTIGTGGNITLNTGGNLTVNGGGGGSGALTLYVLNNDGGDIGTGGNISVTTGGDLTAGSIDALIDNRNGGTISSSANLTFDIGAALMTTQDATFVITNRNDGSGGGVMNGNVTLDLSAANISSGGDLVTDISANRGGHILGNAFNHVSAAGDLTAQGALDFEIENAGFLLNNVFVPGGTIDMDATINVSATNISATTDYFQALISNAGGGHIGGNAVLDISASNGLTSGGDAFFSIINSPNGQDTPAGTIGGNATIEANVGSMSVGGLLDAVIDNTNGSIGGNAIVNFDLSGAIDTHVDADFQIFNRNNGSGGGNIGGNATVNVTAANITANSLTAQIDNTGGTIGGNAAINMNVSGNTSITTEATVQVLGNDPSGSAAINFNGGSYDIGSPGSGGTFLSSIDGNGTITFNNASAHADVLKAGVFGANGALNISGGTLSADSILKLYAPGSNGQLNFMSSVTLGGNSVILAANSITIFDTVVVTISGPMADVYTNHANYMGSGGNNSTSGTFGGAGANNPQPLINAPPFGPFSPTPITTKPRIHPRPPVTTGVINVSSSDELLALLDDFTPGRGERVRMLDSRRGNHGRHASRFNTAAYLNAARRAMDRRTAATPAMRRLPQ